MHAMFLSVDQVRELDILLSSHTFERIEDGDEWPKILLSHTSSKIRAFGITQLPDILSKAFSVFLSCTRGVVGDACLDMLIAAWKEEFAWEGMRFGWKWRLTPAFVIRFEARLYRGLP